MRPDGQEFSHLRSLYPFHVHNAKTSIYGPSQYNLFTVYLTILSTAHTTQTVYSRMLGLLVNN
jgi:hypothetical protein